MFFSVKVFDMPLLSSAQHRIMKNVVLMAEGAMLHTFANCFIDFLQEPGSKQHMRETGCLGGE